jgi:hypothetical protein
MFGGFVANRYFKCILIPRDLFMSIAFLNAEWLHATERTLLGAAYHKARNSLQDEAGLTDSDLDALTDVMTEALLSLFRIGQLDPTKLSNYAVAKTLRHLCAGQR